MTNARYGFNHAERRDPTLSAEGLEGLLPREQDSRLDPSLAVTALNEFFTGHRRGSLGSSGQHDLTARALDGEAHDSNGVLAGLFPDVPEADVDEALTIATPLAGSPRRDLPPAVDTRSEPEHSEIQRAVAEFQLFAERFHAFATKHRHGALAVYEN
jgi:hypothetical protein